MMQQISRHVTHVGDVVVVCTRARISYNTSNFEEIFKDGSENARLSYQKADFVKKVCWGPLIAGLVMALDRIPVVGNYS